jgi:formylmethanofuran dehydrogenase subunit C
MSGWTFKLRHAPALRVDLRGVLPAALAALSAAEVERLPLGHGNTFAPLAEFFVVTRAEADATMVFDADLARFDHVGRGMDGGTLIVEGHVGDHAGTAMRGGELRVRGSAGALAACEMAGGSLVVHGDVGEFAAGALPGSMDGMRGGTLVVHGHAGARLGDRMRRGSVVVFGDAGEFMASRMVAGTIALGGRCGPHPGYGMRRGSVVFAGPAPQAPPTFVPAHGEAAVFWQLLARDLARHGGVFESLPTCAVQRWLGDLSADGKGELIAAR